MSGQSSPNVVLVYIDDLGYRLAAYGGDIPLLIWIDWPSRGFVFCLLHSQSSLLPQPLQFDDGADASDGKYGMSRGMPFFCPTLAQVMQRVVMTGQIGKWDIGSANQGPAEMGFQSASSAQEALYFAEMAQMPPALAKKFSP